MDNKKASGIFIPRSGFYLWMIFVLVGVITILDWRVAVPGYALLLALVYHNIRSNYIRQKEITRYIENLTFNIDTATKDTLLNFPMPLVLTQLDGTIIWYNSSFRRIFEGESLLEKTISSFVEELNPDGLVDDSSNINRDIVIKDRHFCVLGNIVKVEEKNGADDYIMLLYFVDNTELVTLKKHYAEERPAVAIIVIDNYDELMQNTEDMNHPHLLAEIDRRIGQWAGFTGGILRKYERDRYLLVFESKYLKLMEEKKFAILDAAKEINLGNKIPVTLSLGLGANAKTLSEAFHFAGAALDIALGRGGDQVVLKSGESFSFFGGSTRELEKRTKVKARVISNALREFIDQSPVVMIMGHEYPDIDCLGASLGLYRIAVNRGKETYIVLDSSNISIDRIMGKIVKDPQYEGMFISHGEALDRINNKTLLIVVDTHRPGFTECPELLKYTDQVVVIDHHRKGADFIRDAVLMYQETYASSTCELVTEMLQYVDEKIKLRPVEAEALYAGIVMDTKNFTFKTGVRTFEAASFLRRQGVDTVSVKQLFQNDLQTYIDISNVVKDAEILDEEIAISVCPKDISNPQLIAAQAADQLLSLSGLVAAFVLGSSDNEVFISGRSLGEVNVQFIMEKLGGGGHLSVAGAQLHGISIEDAKQKLKYAIIEYMENQKKQQ